MHLRNPISRRSDLMSRTSFLGRAALTASLALWIAGCGDTTTTPTNTTNTSASTSHAGHDAHGETGHSDATHSHDAEKGHEHEGHGHGEKGPHDGVLVMFEGHEAHLELVVDKATGAVTAYPLDGAAEKEVAVMGDEIDLAVVMPGEGAEPSVVKLTRAEGEPVKFTGQSDALKGQDKWTGAFAKVHIGGKEYADTKFKFPEGNHDH
jgi:hypothetical protein